MPYYSDGQFRQILKELLLSHEVVLCCSMGKTSITLICMFLAL